jgi:hypothetical protein
MGRPVSATKTSTQMRSDISIPGVKDFASQALHNSRFIISTIISIIQLGAKYCTIFEFGRPIKLVILIKMCLYVTSVEVRIFEKLSDAFPILNSLKQAMLYRHAF